jgi:hypothetical protein
MDVSLTTSINLKFKFLNLYHYLQKEDFAKVV